ncbi:MAG TPA: hypothetical protein VHE35_21845 [Kofleriaceae bacterium]|nr:hypothetical protein [Kofleriaceae bacterium]
MSRARVVRGGLVVALGGLALAAVPARPADACGSGGEDSSSSSSSAGSSSGTPQIVEPVYTPPCEDGSDVVGYRTCTPYGAWSTIAQLPKVSFDLGLWSSMVDLHGVDVAGSMTHSDGTHYSYRVVGSDLGGDADAVGVISRLLLHHGATYAGLEGAAGGVVTDNSERTTPMAGFDLSSRGSTVAVGGVVAGGRVFAGRVSVGGELMAGVRGIAVASTSTHGACVSDDVHWATSPTVELRARGDLWLTPWFTAGAYLGRDALGGQTSGGVDLGFHLRAFDGR